MHVSADHDRIIVFVANPTAEPSTAKMQLSVPVKSMTDLWESKPVVVEDSAWTDKLLPYTIKIYECTK